MRVCQYFLQLVVTPKEAVMAGQEAPVPHNEEQGRFCPTHVALNYKTTTLVVWLLFSLVIAGNALVEGGKIWVSSVKQAG